MPAATSSIEDKVRAIAERVAASEGLEIVEVEWRGGSRAGVLRIFIDKEGGVTHGDCETVSRQVSTILDVEDVIPGDRYNLEVSSPGLDRKLLKRGDYERFAGKKVKVKLRDPVDGKKQVVGRLEGLDSEGRIALDLGGGESFAVDFEDVAQTRLVIEI